MTAWTKSTHLVGGDIFFNSNFPRTPFNVVVRISKTYKPIPLEKMNNYHTPVPHSMLYNEIIDSLEF